VVEELQAIDEACSRFRPDSDLARLNNATGSWTQVQPLLIEALGVALRAAEITDGLVDPTVGEAVQDAGYSDDFARVPADGPAIRMRVRPVPGWRLVQLNRRASSARLPPGVTLDLGATAKGLAADLAASAAHLATGAGVLVSCGGDIAIAGTPPEEGWHIRVSEFSADGPEAPGQSISLSFGGVATSGVTARRWRRGGRELHHIIDPATGVPAETCWRWVSVVAATCVDANIASTAAVIMGDAAPAWLEAHGLAARLVHADGGITRVGGWPSGGESRGGEP
jgi:thiamine biosynthesis lipoprotein ApbE